MPEIRERVTGTIAAQGDWRAPVTLTLRTSSSDPLALLIDFYSNKGGEQGEPNTWTMALELLHAAYGRHSGVVGEGDVIFNCASSYSEISIDLRSPEGTARVFIPRQAAREFLRNAATVTTEEDTQATIDDELEAFLANCE